MDFLPRLWLLLVSCWQVTLASNRCPTVVGNRYSQAGKDLFDVGKYIEAIECLEMAVERAAVPQSFTNLAAAQMEAKLYESCEKSCMKALEVNPKYIPAIEALSALYQRQGRHMDALAYDHKAFKYSLTNIEPLIRMAEDLHELGRYSRSMLYIDKALQMDSKSLAANARKAIALFEESQFVKAANLAHEVLENNPSDNQQEGIVQRILLASLLKTGRADLAVVHSSRWLSTTASSQDVNCALMNIQRLINAFDREKDHRVGVRLLFFSLLEKRVTQLGRFHYICSPHMFFYLPATQEQRTAMAKFVSASHPSVLTSFRQSYQRLFERFPIKYKHLNGSRLRVGIIGSCFHRKHALALFLLRIVTKFLDNNDRVVDIYLYIEGAMYYYKWPNRLTQLRKKLADHKKNRDVPLFNAQVHYITLTYAFVRAHEKYIKGRKRKFYIEVTDHEDYNTNKQHIRIIRKG